MPCQMPLEACLYDYRDAYLKKQVSICVVLRTLVHNPAKCLRKSLCLSVCMKQVEKG